MTTLFDSVINNALRTAQNAGRYYRKGGRSVLDFIEQNADGSLAQPGDPVNIPIGMRKALGGGNLIRPNPMFDTGNLDPVVVDDGSVIENYQLNNNLAMKTQPVLESQSEPVTKNPGGVLTNVQTTTPTNRRDQTPMSFKPQIIDDNEMLIRMGMAGLGANPQGASASLGAMGDMYGAIQDTNRSGINKYNLAMQQAQVKAANAKAKTLQENQAKAGQLDQTIFDMDQALANLEGGMELTGWLDSTIGAAWDSLKGNPEAAARLLLKKLKVDDALLRVAQTKGAISNNEMRLFLSPAPAETQDEKVWIDWIRKRRNAAVAIRHRLLTGERVNPNEQATPDQVNQYGSGQSTYSAEDQALIDKYDN